MKNTITLTALMSTALLMALSHTARAEDNIAACEIVILKPVMPPQDREVTSQDEPPAMIATFLPADDFLFSVFDSTPEFISSVDGNDIRAVMCKRNNVIPTEFDLKIIRTGIPLHLSQNFDSPNSPLMSIRKDGGKYVYTSVGLRLNEDDKAVLKLRLKSLNAPHQKRADVTE